MSNVVLNPESGLFRNLDSGVRSPDSSMLNLLDLALSLIRGSGREGGAKWGCIGSQLFDLAKNIKQKSTSILLWAHHIFGPVIPIWKDLGHMYFWSRGQSILLTLNYFYIMSWPMPGTTASIIYIYI
jgi:hypothetical protein